MSRVIKFRAWCHGGGDPRVQPYMEFSGSNRSLFWRAVDEFPLGADVMQFTGLQDRNGTDIYESDILGQAGEALGVVVFLDAGFRLDGDSKTQEPTIIPQQRAARLAVIGNIHESKHLLEGDEK